MSIVKKTIAVIAYLLLISVLLQFEFEKLIDIKQLLLVIIGMLLFYFPNYSRKQHDKNYMELRQIGKSAILVSSIQTFVLLFILLQRSTSFDNLLYQVALNCRPLLYGFCIWIILNEDKVKKVELPMEQNVKSQEMTAEQRYYRFIELGLTRREAEIAIQICKGLSNGEVAEELSISEATVKKHISNIFEKLQISRREQVRGKL